MKKVLFSLSILSILFITSCGKDDGASVQLGLDGSITFDGTDTEMSDGLIIDFGTNDSEYNYDFYIANGAISIEDLNINVNGNTLMVIEFYNEGAAFSPGTFTVNGSGARYCFVDIAVDDQNDFASGGTVTVTGSGQTYKVVFDLDFSEDRTLTGTVEGGFAIQNALSFQ